jgi:hypothetical protein
MHVFSTNGGYSRNFGTFVSNGVVTIDADREHLRVRVRDGIVVERIETSKNERTTLRFGQGFKLEIPGKKRVSEEYYQKDSIRAIRRGCLWKREKGVPFCGSEGILECYSTSGGAFGKEVFKYKNGKPGYITSRWRKKLEISRPNGKRWMVIKGIVRLDRTPFAERLTPNADDLNLAYCMRSNNWDVLVYDTDGTTLVTQGKVENRQKVGKWLEKGKTTHYMAGVKVSRELYEEDPKKWNAQEVLRVPNAQLRCSLLKKMGYNALLEKVKPRILDHSDDGGQLLEIDSGIREGTVFGMDKMMRLVKVICPSTSQVYLLRVPPNISKFEQARQWTLGLQREGLEQGARFNLIRET